GFAVGMLLDNAERCDEAFPCFAEANALHRQQRAAAGERFDIDALRRQVDDLIELATPDFFSAAASWGNASQAPVFGAGELPALGEIWETLSAHNRGRPVEKWDAALARRLADRHLGSLQALGDGAVGIID